MVSHLRVHQIVRSFATQSKLVFRKATTKDISLITRNAIQEGFHVGPYDYSIFLELDPHHYYMCEINGKVAAHCGVTYFPNSHYHGGGLVVKEEFRKQGVRKQIIIYTKNRCDPNYTIGVDVITDTWYNTVGFATHWEHYIAMLDLEKLSTRIDTISQTKNLLTESISSDKGLDKLLEYDQSVFGTCRETFIKRWINTPGSFGWAAIDKSSNKITGYTVLKQVIRGGGTEIGLAMAPLFADNAEVAKFLINRATEECLTNPAIPKTKLEIFHPVGDVCGEGAAELMKDLDAELIHDGYRIYSNGVPPGRQTKKIYGIASPSCD